MLVTEYERFFQDCVPGFAGASVCNVGNTLGIRETRHLNGVYMLTLEDIFDTQRFDDAVACSAWPIEQHGEGTESKWVLLKPGEYY